MAGAALLVLTHRQRSHSNHQGIDGVEACSLLMRGLLNNDTRAVCAVCKQQHAGDSTCPVQMAHWLRCILMPVTMLVWLDKSG